MMDKEPRLQDEVKHKRNDMSGTVIAVWIGGTGIKLLDVRGVDGKLYYKTPADNWMVVKECDE